MDSTHKVHSQQHQETPFGEEFEEIVLPQHFFETAEQTTHNADQNNTQTDQTVTRSSDDSELKETSDHIETEDIQDKSDHEPQDLILKALKDNKYELFSSLLKKPGVDLKFKYGKPDNTSLIELACRLHWGGKFVEILLENGIKPNVHEIHPQPIHYAAKCGNHTALKALLKHKKTNVNVVDSSGRTALHHAVHYGDKTQKKKTTVKVVDSSTQAPLHYAARYSDKTQKKKTTVKVVDSSTQTDLHHAVRYSDKTKQNETTVNVVDTSTKTDSHHAARYRDKTQKKKTTVKVVDSSTQTDLHHAVRYSDKTKQNETTVNVEDSSTQTDLPDPVHYNHKGKPAEYDRCIELLLGRPDLALNIPNEDGYTAVHEAANFSKTAVVLILRQRKDDVDLDSYMAKGRTARECIQTNYPDLEHLLPVPRFKYKSKDLYAQLLSSLKNRQLKKFHDILCLVDEEGIAQVDPNYFYEDHFATCLEIACREKDSDMYVEELLRAGADPNIVNQQTKNTALHLAGKMGNIEVLSVLLEDTRTNVNAVNAEGKTVMHLIAEHGLKTDKEKASPQQGQANQEDGVPKKENEANQENKEEKQENEEEKKENEEAMNRLKDRLIRRKSEIDISLRDKEGLTALDVSLQNGKTEILEFMVQYFLSSLVVDGKLEPRMEAVWKDICNNYPHLCDKLTENMTEHRLNREQTLFQYLYNGKFEEFTDNFSEVYKDIDNGHYTLLQFATLHNLPDAVRLLLESGADPNGTTEHDKRPPIITACINKNNEIVKHLLDIDPHNKLDINATDGKGNTALHHAAEHGNPEALEALLQHKETKVNVVDRSGRTAFHYALRYSDRRKDDQYERCIELLLRRPDLALNIPNEDGNTAVHEAANFSKTAVKLILKQRKYDVDLDSYSASGRTARECIQTKYPELKHLLPEPRFKYQSLDHHSQLLAALQNRQLKTFHDILCLVDENGIARVDPNYFYEGPHYATCLEIACTVKDSAEYVKKLLRAGADPNFVNPKTKNTALHLAGEMGNIEVLTVLLEDKRTNVNAVNAEGKTVMHLIAEHGLKTDNEEATAQQGKENQGNGEITQENEQTNQEKEEEKQENEQAMLRLKSILIRRKSEIDISLRDKSGLSALDVCLQNGNTDILEFIVEQRLNPQQRLFQHLYDRKYEDFIKHLSKDCKDIDNGHYTLLQYATLHNLLDYVQQLLESGADPNRTTKKEKRPPIIIACINNNDEIMKLFLDLVPNKKLDVNATDDKGNTALHHAAKTENLDLVVDLIKYGANVQHKNIFGKPPLPLKSVQYFLDNSLIANSHFPHEEDYEIIFDYGFLVAHKEKTKEAHLTETCHEPLLTVDEESGGRNVQVPDKPNPEMDFLFFVSTSNEHREILKHPIITSFLHMKWQLVKNYFYINLCIYVIFAFLLNAYILLKISHNTTNETESTIRPNGTKTSESNSLQTIPEGVAWGLILLILLYFTAREILQLTLSLKFYVTNSENILDISLIFFSGYILLWSEWQETCVVITILLTWTEFILLTGRLPKLSNNIEMLKTVSLNYFWFLFSYIFLLIAFAFSFYSLLHKSANQSSTKNDDSEDQHFFTGPIMSVMKTFIMMMGEFDTDSTVSELANSWTYFCLFALFLFIISMVLLNLLTGLAVSDTQTIKSNAEYLSLVSRIRRIYEIESTLFQWCILVEKFPQYELLRPFATLPRRLLKKTCLFSDTSHNKRIHVLPNMGLTTNFGHNNTDPDSNGQNNTKKMKLPTIKEAIDIISKRGPENGINNTKEHFSHTQETLDSKLLRIEGTINHHLLQNDHRNQLMFNKILKMLQDMKDECNRS